MKDKTCEICQGTGWIIEEKDGNTFARRCDCFEKEKINYLLSSARIPPRYQHCTFENFDPQNASQKRALKISKKFVENYPIQDIGLLFLGPCGVGKTHLAVAICHELIKTKAVPCLFYDFRELIKDIQSSYSSESEFTESEILLPVIETEILVLDELGAKRPSSWVEEMLFYIINQRYNKKKLTIFTSNFPDEIEKEETTFTPDLIKSKDEETLTDRIGYRLRSRIYEMCKTVEIEGEDFRKKVRQGSYRF
ncbi:ATP-binding protein [Candidatus Aminicenantes bacterium AC-335-B20]|jgi:DNA replication protein DnaC|nr:ATP-binding protein [SCandidatus Aminicenantes bacterium Aminicenantia_JdfR_composite]MCP2596338.1 ATP-binding protein [Candidatus Aminicenantes bacterium AC-335-G13]MCP2598776.1 ATP-binding protein [Candidatus Aminicenantes bacterium AC-335-L06]MCP2599006.1 ATP-binding protein [Candidatus Aminicenantes bacterium AC-335-B20]MCP2605421.1 ATP-binding protein [Candidatus Aminicenantes bacterium AC-335-O07]MCP2617813.1 ATP-binding protein [Candidatus Aminicenantes bacterium AC-335-A11]